MIDDVLVRQVLVDREYKVSSVVYVLLMMCVNVNPEVLFEFSCTGSKSYSCDSPSTKQTMSVLVSAIVALRIFNPGCVCLCVCRRCKARSLLSDDSTMARRSWEGQEFDIRKS